MVSRNQTRNQLLDAGVKLFAEYDYAQVSNKMITDEVEVNSAMISYYFKSKENFYREVVIYTADIIISKFENFKPQNIETATKDELIEQISIGLDIYLEAFFSGEGRNFSIIYYRNLINAIESHILSEYNRPIETVTNRYLPLLNAYYQKAGLQDVNVIFIMQKIASFVYFVILHEHAGNVLMPQYMDATKMTKNILLHSVLSGC